MSITSATSRLQPQNIVNNLPIVGQIAQGAQANKSAGDIVGDVFKTILDPLGLFSGPDKPPTAMTGEGDKILSEVTSNQGARDAYNNFDWDSYNKQVDQVASSVGEQAANLVSTGQLSPEQIGDWVKQRIDAAGLPTPPENPDKAVKPQGAFDWQGYNSAMDKEVEARMKPLLDQFSAGQIDANQLSAMAKQVGSAAASAVSAQYGNPPEIISPSAQKPGYPYSERDEATSERVTAEMDRLMPSIQSGALSGPALDSAIKEMTSRVAADMDARFGTLPEPPQPDPAQDTKEIYDQQRWQMEAQIESMQSSGKDAGAVQAYKLQREAELAQFFPKQTLLNQTREDWKAVAVQMASSGKSPGEIQEWLKKKEEAFTDPTPEELAVFGARKAEEAQQIQGLIQMMEQQKAAAEKAKKKKDEYNW